MGETTPVAFLSYAHHDDEHDGGYITDFRKRLEGEVRSQTGRQDVRIFQDRDDIAWGDAWKERVDCSLDAATFLIPVLTPSFLASTQCRRELRRFLDRERRLGRNDLILPVYLIRLPAMEASTPRDADELAEELAARQYADWRELRFRELGEPEARRALAALATRIGDALEPVDHAGRSLEAIRGNLTQVAGRATAGLRGGDLDAVGLMNLLVDAVRDAAWLPDGEVLLLLRYVAQSRIDRPPGSTQPSASTPPEVPGAVDPAKADSFQSGALDVIGRTLTSMVATDGDSAVATALTDAFREICALGDPEGGTEGTRTLVDPLREAAQARLDLLQAEVERAAEAAEQEARETAAAHAETRRKYDETVRRAAEAEHELARVRRVLGERDAESSRLTSELEQTQQEIARLQDEVRRSEEDRLRSSADHNGGGAGRVPAAAPGAARNAPADGTVTVPPDQPPPATGDGAPPPGPVDSRPPDGGDGDPAPAPSPRNPAPHSPPPPSRPVRWWMPTPVFAAWLLYGLFQVYGVVTAESDRAKQQESVEQLGSNLGGVAWATPDPATPDVEDWVARDADEASTPATGIPPAGWLTCWQDAATPTAPPRDGTEIRQNEAMDPDSFSDTISERAGSPGDRCAG